VQTRKSPALRRTFFYAYGCNNQDLPPLLKHRLYRCTLGTTEKGDCRVKDSSPDWIVSGILAAAAFLVTFIFAGFGFAVSLVIGALFFAGGACIFRVRHPVQSEVPLPDLDSALQEGRRKLSDIRALGKKIQVAETCEKIERITVSIERILVEIKRDPADLKRARQFLSYYLDATITIINKYATLSSQSVNDRSIAESLARAERMLDTLDQAFGKQLARLLSNDVMDLDTELSLLEKTIHLEGLGDE
jgi:hypothetical protein